MSSKNSIRNLTNSDKKLNEVKFFERAGGQVLGERRNSHIDKRSRHFSGAGSIRKNLGDSSH